ncbi:AbrB family transcriptional regulator [Pseudalkalibacillus caeni]|uniref:AbrB family transcriptional regulator n=1 Tax=Exobacillus caeni TaxID=2574798 RepID=A0A5R9F032_9BACL|nr:AbrB family transcriptional regulator [Pseudalkalibacillus caeni]TLS36867.1 AbrB family transcriptional regulator [Pseudalkalibacillus caeni]
MISKKNSLQMLEAGGIGLAGAMLFIVLHGPLPWMLGPLTSIMGWHLVTKRRLYWPVAFRQLALIVIGYMLGSSFSRRTVEEITEHFPYIIGITVLTILFSFLIGMMFVKSTNLSLGDALFGSIPGGLSQVAALSEETEEIDTGMIVILQTVRVVTVIMVIPFLTINVIHHNSASAGVSAASGIELTASRPFVLVTFIILALAGAWLAKKIKMPAAILTGPLVTVAVLSVFWQSAPVLPSPVIIVSQFLLGIHLGLYIKPEMITVMKKVGVLSIITSLLLVTFSFVLAFLLTKITSIDLPTAFLSTAPGGLAEMGVTATIVHADLSMISGYQLFRLFFIIFVALPVLQWWIRRRGIQNRKSQNQI